MNETSTPQPAEKTRAPRKPVKGLCSKATEKGLAIDETWYDYGRVFKQADRPKPSAVLGMIVLATLVESPKDKRSYVASIDQIEPAPAGEGPTKGSAGPGASSEASPNSDTVKKLTVKQLNAIEKIAESRLRSIEEVDKAVVTLTGYSLENLSGFRANVLIQLMLGHSGKPKDAEQQK